MVRVVERDNCPRVDFIAQTGNSDARKALIDGKSPFISILDVYLKLYGGNIVEVFIGRLMSAAQ